jgi:hypothetical protein
MSNEADSRHTVPSLRWAETAAEVPLGSPDLVEPSSGAKDLGWVAATTPNRGWFNFLGWGVGVLQRYLLNAFGLLWPRDHLMAGAGAGEGAVTAGAGLSVNVTLARVWIDGAMYAVPAATNLALAAADPTNPRIDLVYAKLTSGVPEYAVVTGTPAGSPAAPSLPAGGVSIATVAVAALAVAPGAINSTREFGAIALDKGEFDTVEVDSEFGAGWNGTRHLVKVTDATSMHIGTSAGDALFWAETLTPSVGVKPSAFQLETAITRKFDIPPSAFQTILGDDPGDVVDPPPYGNADFYGPGWNGDAAVAPASALMAAVRIPEGCTITAVRIYTARADSARGMNLGLLETVKETAALTTVASASMPIGSGSIGNVTLAATGLAVAVDQGNFYQLQVTWTGSGECQLYGAEVEYTEIRPFQTL